MRPGKGQTPFVVVLVTLVILGLIIAFFWQVFIYVRRIKAGDVGVLPQFTGLASLTSIPDGAIGSNGTVNVATDDDPSLGPKDAKLTIVEFIDFQCPYSKQASDVVRALAAKYSDKVRFIIRDYPIVELHPEAQYAAEAAGCAEAQGKFWGMHDRLFAGQDAGFNRDAFDKMAQASGADVAKFDACLTSRERVKEIQDDQGAGLAAGVRGTPTFFFNGQKVEGAIPADIFEKLIQSFLNT